MEKIFEIEGMTCASCVTRVEKGFRKVDGVLEAKVNLATNSALLILEKEITEENLTTFVKKMGYQVKEIKQLKKNSDGETQKAKMKFLTSLPFAVFVLVFSMLPMVFPPFEHFLMEKMFFSNILQFIFSGIVLFFCGKDFFVHAFKSATQLTADMNTLVSVGTGSAFVFSALVTFFPSFFSNPTDKIYYDSASTVVSLILLGKWLETKAKSNTSEAIQKLMNLMPKIAHKITENGLSDIQLQEIKKGDLLLVKPGEIIPTDGKIIEGTPLLDESMITGESNLVEKNTNQQVIGGSLNQNKSFTMEATKIGNETFLANIVKTVQIAQSSKPPIQQLTDKIASVFAPTVILIALLTFAFWIIFDGNFTTALINSVSVLVIACPCALGLATPTAIIASTGKAAELGILIKDAESLEQLCKVKTIAFDKTGTLTEGKPKVTNSKTAGNHTENEVLTLLYSFEKESEHSIAKAIKNLAHEKEIFPQKIDSFEAVSGFGIKGKIGNSEFLIGNKSLLKLNKINFENFEKTEAEFSEAGFTNILIAKDGEILGIFAISDNEKENAKTTLSELKSNGIETVLITGDTEKTAKIIANKLEITKFFASVLPNEKYKIVKDLQKNGNTVAFVGDGINDAPALAQAEIGIAMATGTDIAMETAQITILSGDLSKIPQSIKLAKFTVKIVKQNLFWAFFYNVIGIPLAAFGFLNPIFAGTAMALSSVSVVSNSLRIKNFLEKLKS
ncbi:copper-translocating P-type ATPase [bacterium]|nr:copper-translocating P-type ATPase [bacterium]